MNEQKPDIFSWFVIMAVLVALTSVITACDNGDHTSTPSPSVDRGSFEHRYATERFKQEGYSARESQQAADAVTKFMRAQEARKR